MKLLKIGLFVAVTIAGCKGKPAPGGESAAMQDMKGMPGMPAASPDSSGVPINRTEAQRLASHSRASERPVQSSVRALGVLSYAEPNRAYVNARWAGGSSIYMRLRRQTRRTRRTAARPVLPRFSQRSRGVPPGSAAEG